MSSFQESDLIAYHLQELSPGQARAIRRALKLNPELDAQSEAILSALRLFDKTENIPMVDAAALNRNWNAIYPSLEVLRPQARWQQWRLALSIGAALALLTLAALYLSRQSSTNLPNLTSVAGREQLPTPINPASATQVSGLRSGTSEAHLRQTVQAVSTPFLSTPFEQGANAATDLVPPTQPLHSSQLTTPQPLHPTPQAPDTSHAPQAPNGSSAPVTPNKRKRRETDFSAGVFGNFTVTRSPGYTTGSGATASSETRSQAAVPAAGGFATFHQQLSPLLGYSVTAGYTHTTFNYTYGASNSVGGFFQRGGIGTHVIEFTSSYVAQGPRTKRISSFAEAGGGMLTFIPTTSTQNDSYVFRPTAVAGVGVNLKLTPRLAFRTEYRGLYFKGPDFRYHNGSIPVTTRYTLSSEPTVGLTYEFGKHSK